MHPPQSSVHKRSLKFGLCVALTLNYYLDDSTSIGEVPSFYSQRKILGTSLRNLQEIPSDSLASDKSKMCVYRSQEKNMELPTGMKTKLIKKLNFKILTECGIVVTIWTLLTCAIQLANGAPLDQDTGGRVGFGNLQMEKVSDDLGTAPKSTSFAGGFISSLSMIVVSELGDKTFFIAAVMAMRHSRLVVFSGALSALAIMTVLSALFGYVTTFIPRVYTYYISTALFAIFGFKMLYDGILMSSDEGAEELEEVQMDLRQREENENTPLCDKGSSSEGLSPPSKSKLQLVIRRILFTCFSKVYIQALTMTFLAEWGDRSQLATVVLAARENLLGICLGGVLGHSLCTGLAVVGGRMIAQKISVKTVTIIGGFVFLGFAVVSLFLDPN